MIFIIFRIASNQVVGWHKIVSDETWPDVSVKYLDIYLIT